MKILLITLSYVAATYAQDPFATPVDPLYNIVRTVISLLPQNNPKIPSQLLGLPDSIKSPFAGGASFLGQTSNGYSKLSFDATDVVQNAILKAITNEKEDPQDALKRLQETGPVVINELVESFQALVKVYTNGASAGVRDFLTNLVALVGNLLRFLLSVVGGGAQPGDVVPLVSDFLGSSDVGPRLNELGAANFDFFSKLPPNYSKFADPLASLVYSLLPAPWDTIVLGNVGGNLGQTYDIIGLVSNYYGNGAIDYSNQINDGRYFPQPSPYYP